MLLGGLRSSGLAHGRAASNLPRPLFSRERRPTASRSEGEGSVITSPKVRVLTSSSGERPINALRARILRCAQDDGKRLAAPNRRNLFATARVL